MPEFVKVAHINDIPPGEKLIAEVDGSEVVVVNLDGTLYAMENVCTHDGGPLGEGKLAGHALICPRHGARFDVRTGAALTRPAFEPAAVFAVKVEGNDVLVETL